MALNEEGVMIVPGIDSRWVQLQNGARAHYSAAGSSGPPVILIHGGIVGSSGQAGWRYMIPAWASARANPDAVVDLPSRGLELVTTIDRSFLPTAAKWTFVRRLR